jgi:hypothetical protein
MKMTEFYEKYWTVDGLPVPALSEKERLVWDAAEHIGEPPYIKTWKRRLGWQYIVNPLVQEHIDANAIDDKDAPVK